MGGPSVFTVGVGALQGPSPLTGGTGPLLETLIPWAVGGGQARTGVPHSFLTGEGAPASSWGSLIPYWELWFLSWDPESLPGTPKGSWGRGTLKKDVWGGLSPLGGDSRVLVASESPHPRAGAPGGHPGLGASACPQGQRGGGGGGAQGDVDGVTLLGGVGHVGALGWGGAGWGVRGGGSREGVHGDGVQGDGVQGGTGSYGGYRRGAGVAAGGHKGVPGGFGGCRGLWRVQAGIGVCQAWALCKDGGVQGVPPPCPLPVPIPAPTTTPPLATLSLPAHPLCGAHPPISAHSTTSSPASDPQLG